MKNLMAGVVTNYLQKDFKTFNVNSSMNFQEQRILEIDPDMKFIDYYSEELQNFIILLN